jgi:hypothetical protein
MSNVYSPRQRQAERNNRNEADKPEHDPATRREFQGWYWYGSLPRIAVVYRSQP